MALKDLFAKSKDGFVASSDFPVQTRLLVSREEGERSLTFVYPNNETYVVRHDQVRYATILCLGVVGMSWGEDGLTGGKKIKLHTTENHEMYGFKYKAEFTDGKVAIITAYLGVAQRVEAVLF
ncbi:MAG: hypothetical protein IJL47_01835 [Lachnospiraceae bacterium]|nr:hypothetical protein [Lachnospiraceae bacterium]